MTFSRSPTFLKQAGDCSVANSVSHSVSPKTTLPLCECSLVESLYDTPPLPDYY